MRSQLQKLVKGFSIETTTQEARGIKNFARILKSGTRVFIAHESSTDPAEVISLCKRLREQKMEPVPHIAARRIKSVAFLEDFLQSLIREAGVVEVLVIAGSIPKPLGPFDNSLQILELGILERFGIRKAYVAAHPEGNRGLGEQVLRDFLIRKNFYARRVKSDVRVITDLSFSADALVDWESANGRALNSLPILVSVPGVMSGKDLIKYGTDFGIPSVKVLKDVPKSTKNKIQAPDAMLLGLAQYKKQNPKSLLGGVHFFAFEGLSKTAAWANKIAAGKFRILKNGSGIKILI